MLSFIGWIILGALAGWIASLIAGTNRQQGCLIDIVVGIIGAFIGGYVVRFFGINPNANFIISLITAVIGAVILLFIVKAIQRRS